MSDSHNNSSFEIVVIFPPQTQNWYKLSSNRYKIRKKNAEYLYDVQDWLPFCKQDDWFSKFSGTSKSLQYHLRELDRQMYVFVRHIEKLYSIRTLSKGYRYLSSGNLQTVAAHSLVLLLRILLDYLIRFSCISKHCISIDKKRKLPHSRDRCVKDKNRKK